MSNVPILLKEANRKKSIIDNTPAVFPIKENPNANSKRPNVEIDGQSQVSKWCGQIINLAKKHKVDANLVMAIMHMETTHAWYDAFVPMNKTVRPMNIHYKYWLDLGVTKEKLEVPLYNIEYGIILIKRIQERITDPTITKIATIYNFLGAEKVNDYGARVNHFYITKPWRNQGCVK